MRRKSDEAKMREGFGKGEGAGYRPYIKSREFNSQGTAVTLRDYKTGRNVELLSQGEAMYWHILRFRDDVIDIREQLPLPLNEVNEIAEEMGISPPRNGKTPLTTDFFIVFNDRHMEAHAFKPSKRSLERDRTVELLSLEQKFWESKKVPWKLIFKTDLDPFLASNIRVCSYYWEESSVFDMMSCLKHMIIRKDLSVDMEKKDLEFPELLREHFVQIHDRLSELQHAIDE